MAAMFDLKSAIRQTPEHKRLVEETLNGAASDDERPQIQITTDMRPVVDAAQEAILSLPGGPYLYQRSQRLCRIAHGTKPPVWLQRAPESPSIVLAEPPHLRELLSNAALWVKFEKRSKTLVPALPPEWVQTALAARLSWPFPPLEGIVCCPTLRWDGEVIATPGYDVDTGLFLDTGEVEFPPVPPAPTRDEAIAALTALWEPLSEFPFAHPCHASAALAALLTMIGRSAIRGPVPMFAVRSNTPGTGKGLLIDALSLIATGRSAPHWPQVKEEEEDRKRFLAIALSGDVCIHIDNVTRPFGNGVVDSALTTMSIKDRLLGASTNLEAPWLAVLFASGNNMRFAADTFRRVVPIDLDPKTEKPEEREFTKPRLLEWVTLHRPRLVTAGLTLLRAFFIAGCPKHDNVSSFGSFEYWSDLIRHALLWVDMHDPCEKRTDIRAEEDGEYEQHFALLLAWVRCYKLEKKTLKMILQDITQRYIPEPNALNPPNEWNDLHEALAAFDTKYDGKRPLDTKRLADGLNTIKGKVIGDYRLIVDGKDRVNATYWRIESI